MSFFYYLLINSLQINIYLSFYNYNWHNYYIAVVIC